MTFQPFLGFAPDMDYDTPGAFSDCQHMVPTPRGMRVQPGWATLNSSGTIVPGGQYPVTGFGYGINEGGVVRFAGTRSKLYRSFGGTGWQDVSRSGGYSSSINNWSFAPFGDDMVAAATGPAHAAVSILQRCDMRSGVAESITGAPQAHLVVAASRFVLAFGDQDYADRWRCSARDDHTSWTASLATLAATGRIVEDPGPFTAAVEFNNDVIAFKYQSMYLGRFTGAPEVWTWQRLPFGVGCPSKRGVCKVPGGVAFVAADDVNLFDGVALRGLLLGKAKEWWAAQWGSSGGGMMAVEFDAPSNQLWVAYGTSSNIDGIVEALVIDMATGRIGRVRYGADMICSSPSASGLLPGAIRVQMFSRSDQFATGRQLVSIDTTGTTSWFDNADFTYARDSAEQAPYFVMPELGDGMSEVELTELRLKWREAPDDATAVHYTRPYAGGPLDVVGERPLSDTKSFQTRANARYHRVKVRLQDNAEMTGYAYEPTPTGRKGAR